MIHQRLRLIATMLTVALPLAACGRVQGSTGSDDGAPPRTTLEQADDATTFRVNHAEQFPIVAATRVETTPTLTATGVVSPDVSRAVPVVSLASGRVVDLRVRLGDRVQKGQLLLRIHSADAASATADYRKALADEALSKTQRDRARELFERGAIARKDLEVAEGAAVKASVDRENTAERMRVLGLNPTAPPGDGVVDVVAPVSGVITEQNVTPAAGVKTLDNSPNLFTIADLSRVWIVCDVYENDLPNVSVGDAADIHVAAYPDRMLTGRVDDIAAVLDPNLRTAKVRVEVANPGILRVGMFVRATLRERATAAHAAVPATAILHLHDREWVYVPARSGDGRFERKAIVSGRTRQDNAQEVMSGLQPGERVVANALVLQNTVEQ